MNLRTLPSLLAVFVAMLCFSTTVEAEIIVNKAPSATTPPCAVSLTTAKKTGEEIKLHINSDQAQQAQIDFGDGTLQSFNLTGKDEGSIECVGVVRGAEIKVYVSQLTVFSCSSYNKISRIEFPGDVSRLEYLTVFDNDIKAISLVGMEALKTLGISSNPISTVDLSPVSGLESLQAVDTKLTNIDLSLCTKLKHINLSQIKTLQEIKGLAGLESPEIVEVKDSPLQSLNLSSANKLIKLVANRTEISSISIPAQGKAGNLRYLYLNNAKLDACALDKLFEDLPKLDPPSKTTNLTINGNTGATKSFTQIATKKGWMVDVAGDGSGCGEFSIVMETAKATGETISLFIDADGPISIRGAKSKNQLEEYTIMDKTIAIRGNVTRLFCDGNSLTSLDVGKCKTLTSLDCWDNELTSLDLSQNKSLSSLVCYSNKISGAAMDELIASLPPYKPSKHPDLDGLYVVNTKDPDEGNVCTKSQVAAAKTKGWRVFATSGFGGESSEYNGTETSESDIEQGSFRIYPNPACEVVFVEGAIAQEEVRLMSLDGRMMRKVYTDARGYARVNLDGLAADTYLLVMGQRAERILVVR